MVNTFLPYADAYRSARALDYRRLGKQRVECKQIHMALHGESKGWVNHPATRMWRETPEALVHYALQMCREWRARGYKDTLTQYFYNEIDKHGYLRHEVKYPDWFGDEAFHLSHQSNLKRKLPEHYGPLFPSVPNDLPYVWPVAK